MNFIKKRIRIQLSIFTACLLLVLTVEGNSQSVDKSHDRASDYDKEFSLLSSLPVPSVKVPTFSFAFEETPFKAALQQVADKGQMKLLFNHSLLLGEYMVSMRLEDVNLRQAFERVLSGTRLDFIVMGNGYVIIIPKLEPKKIQIQQEVITGTVTDAGTGETLPGVNILIKGTGIGTATNMDGNYELTVPSLNDTLVFSFIGFQTQEIPINGRTEINAKMESRIFSGDEVVVVGYGTQRRSNVTGAMASVTDMAIQQVQEQPITNVMQGLTGRVSGVQVQLTGHAPGDETMAVRIRGTGSITAGNEPLYVVDGFPLPGGSSDLSLISPKQIASIEVLKDAASTAIYGSRGGSGVILITTKKGQAGVPRIEIGTFTGIQQLGHKPEMMDTYEYVEWFIDGHNNAWIQAGGSADDPNEVRTESYYKIPDEYYNPASLPNVDWVDEIFRSALIQNYHATISGGTENTTYSFGGGYTNEEGIMIGTDHEKVSFYARVSSGTIYDWLNIGGSLNVAYNKSNRVNQGRNSPTDFSLRAPPVNPVWNEELNQYGMALNSEYFVGDDASPVESAIGIDDLNKNYQTLWRGYVDLELAPRVHFNSSISGFFDHGTRAYYRPSYVSTDSNLAPNPVDAESSASSSVKWLWKNTLSYNQLFGQHEINTVVGFTTQSQRNESNEVEATNFPNNQVRTLSAGQISGGGSSVSEFSMISYLARINYAYDNRYLLTATARTDASSRFGANNKWGFFPSGSLGWRISEENFMQDMDFISELKIRFSYGFTGNNSIPNYGAIGTLSVINNVVGEGSGSVETAVAPNSISNPDLSWEKTEQVDIGLDLGLFDNRIYLVVDFYNSITKDLLLDVPISTITGFSSQLQNIGKVRNRGLEFSLHTRNIQTSGFFWNTDFNISFNRNIVLATGPDNQPLYGSATSAPDHWITRVGAPIASIYGYDFIGVFQTQEDLDNYPHLTTDGLGDPIIRDVNGDGVIDAGDRTIIGNNQPDFYFGISNYFSHKNFDLGIQIAGSYGVEVSNITSRFNEWYHGDRNARQSVVNRYRSPEEPGDGTHFIANRLYEGLQKEPSSYWVEDASYLRIQNVALGYNFQSIGNLPFRSGRIYLSVSNLFTFTNYWGFDPAASTSGSGLARGGDWGAYPPARVFTLGLNISI